jgi:hypothetical protein
MREQMIGHQILRFSRNALPVLRKQKRLVLYQLICLWYFMFLERNLARETCIHDYTDTPQIDRAIVTRAVFLMDLGCTVDHLDDYLRM